MQRYKSGVSNSRPASHMRPMKALFEARDTLCKILKICDKNKLFDLF